MSCRALPELELSCTIRPFLNAIASERLTMKEAYEISQGHSQPPLENQCGINHGENNKCNDSFTDSEARGW